METLITFFSTSDSVWKLIGIAGVLGTTIFGAVWKRLKSSIIRENRRNIGSAFSETVAGLSSANIEVRMSSAILLRRFLDENTEFGVGNAPFAKDAVNVISAVLKTLKSSELQKVLADSLRFAPRDCLVNGDFQRANLSKAYLGEVGISFENADFYQANLSGASFKGACIKNGKFCEAKLVGTVFTNASMALSNFSSATCQQVSFKNADLRNSVFDGATLRDVDFTGALLDGASFANVNGWGITGCIGLEKLSNVQQVAPGNRIFISRPGVLDVRQQVLVDSVRDLIKSFGYEPMDLARDEYDKSNVLANLSQRMSGCGAIIVFGFRSLYVNQGEYRSNTEDSRIVSNEVFPTPWNHIEAGMGLMKGVPVLVLADEGVSDGIFDENVDDPLLERYSMEKCLNANFENVKNWLGSISGFARLTS